MLGIESAGVWLAYLLCILSAILCVIVGLLGWNKADEPVELADIQWAQHQDQVEQDA